MIKITIEEDGQETVVVTLSDVDQKAIQHCRTSVAQMMFPLIIDPSGRIVSNRQDGYWMSLLGKFKTEMCRDGTKMLADAGVSSIPTDKDELILAIAAHPNYKDRAQRDAEEKAKAEAAKATEEPRQVI